MIASEPWLDRHFFRESEMALLIEYTLKCVPILIDNADIVRLRPVKLLELIV